VSPDSTDEPVGHAAVEKPCDVVRAGEVDPLLAFNGFGRVFDTYALLTQADLPSMTVCAQVLREMPVMPMRVPRGMTLRTVALVDAAARTLSAVVVKRWPTTVGSAAGFLGALAALVALVVAVGRLVGFGVAGIVGLASTALGDVELDGECRPLLAAVGAVRAALSGLDVGQRAVRVAAGGFGRVARPGRDDRESDGDDEGGYGDHDGRAVAREARQPLLTGCRHAGFSCTGCPVGVLDAITPATVLSHPSGHIAG